MENTNTDVWEILEQPESQPSSQAPFAARSLLSQAGRHAGRTVARAGEAALGVPGDVASLALSGVNLANKGLAGEWSPTIGKIQEHLPTTENIREHGTKPLSKALGVDLEPQSDIEKASDRFVSDLVGILTPAGIAGALGKGAGITSKALKTAGAVAGVGGATGFITKQLTGNEALGDAVHGGTMLLTSLGLNGSMKKHAKNLYEEGKQLAGTAETSTKPLVHAVNQIQKELAPIASSKAGEALDKFIEKSLNPLLNYPSIQVKHLMDLDKSFNEFVGKNPAVWQKAPEIRKSISSAIESTMKQFHNPEVYNSYKQAKTLYAEANKSHALQNFIKKVIDSSAFRYGAGGVIGSKLFGIGSHYIPDLASMAPGAALMGGVYGLGDVLKRVPGLANPTIQRYYIQAVKAAAAGSRPGVMKALHHLDKHKDLIKEAPSEDVWEII